MRNSIQNLIYAGVAVLGIVGAAVGLARKTDLFDSRIPVVVREDSIDKIVEFPIYNFVKVPPGHCTQYARLASKEISGKDFPPSDAWNMPYVHRVVAELGQGETLEALARKGKLQRGMLIGVVNPETSLVDQKDIVGKPAQNTHGTVYVGLSPEGEVLIGQQLATYRGVLTEKEFRKRGLLPVYVVDVKEAPIASR